MSKHQNVHFKHMQFTYIYQLYLNNGILKCFLNAHTLMQAGTYSSTSKATLPRNSCDYFSYVQLFATPWIVAHQAPLSMEFSRQKYWTRVPFLSPRDLNCLMLLDNLSNFWRRSSMFPYQNLQFPSEL